MVGSRTLPADMIPLPPLDLSHSYQEQVEHEVIRQRKIRELEDFLAYHELWKVQKAEQAEALKATAAGMQAIVQAEEDIKRTRFG